MKKNNKIILGLLTLISFFIALSSYTHHSDTTTTIVNIEVIAYKNKVIAKGGSLSLNKQLYYDTLVSNLKRAGVWNELYELGTMDGGYGSSMIKLKYYNYDTLTNHHFASTDYDTIKGFTGASTKYFDTNFPISTIDNRDISLGFYSHDDGSLGAGMGCSNNTAGYVGWTTTAGSYAQSNIGNSTLYSAMMKGLFSVTSDFNGVTSYINDIRRSSHTQTGTVGNFTGNLLLCSFNNSNYFTGKISLYFVSKSLTSAQTKSLSDAIKKFYTGIGRRNANRIICIGDSETWGTGTSNKSQRWAEILADSMNCEAVISGFSGTLLQYQPVVANSFRSRFKEDMSGHDAQKYFILYGINDVCYNTATVAQYSAQLRYIITFLKSTTDSINIYVGTPPYVSAQAYTRASPWNGGNTTIHQQYVDSTIYICGNLHVKCVDVYSGLKNNGGDSFIYTDHIHMNASGNLFCANLFYSNL